MIALALATAIVCDPCVALPSRPLTNNRSNAILEAAQQDAPFLRTPLGVHVPSADGDILKGLGQRIAVPPLPPAPPLRRTVERPRDARSAEAEGVDTSGLLGGPPR